MRGNRAYLFDLDGTLPDTEILWVPATAEDLDSVGCPVGFGWTAREAGAYSERLRNIL